jgi:hypothetical protein
MGVQHHRRSLSLGGYDMIAIGLFAVAGAILGLAVAFTYVGVNFLNILGADWGWIWAALR